VVRWASAGSYTTDPGAAQFTSHEPAGVIPWLAAGVGIVMVVQPVLGPLVGRRLLDTVVAWAVNLAEHRSWPGLRSR
jgi:LDH2 family malate/lactate/ureidoglycolate dehydrogenase